MLEIQTIFKNILFLQYYHRKGLPIHFQENQDRTDNLGPLSY